jgi:aminoglycoside phosphotransferase
MSLRLPPAIAQFTQGTQWTRDKTGESPCDVHRVVKGRDVFFLKMSPAVYAPTTYSVKREAAVLHWLSRRLSVPEVVLTAETDEAEYMLVRAVPGKPLGSMTAHGRVLDVFREALRQVQSVPLADCPFDSGVAMRLRELDYLLARGLTADDVDLGQWPGIATPADLLQRLQATMPVEDLVFSHGDLGDSNVFVDEHDGIHFIDVGRGGKADRWLDTAFVHRDLRETISPAMAGEFLDMLDRPDAPDKRLYFEQLDELF